MSSPTLTGPSTWPPATLRVLDHFADPAFAQLRDPWDRLIVATATSEALPLVTRDGLITACGLVPTIW